MPSSKHHNNSMSRPKGATSRQPAGTAQEAVGPSPGPYLSPDARGNKPRKNPRGPAPPGAVLTTSDACGNLPQKKARTPVPVHQGRSRRGRPDPLNRDGSGNAGIAEGSLPRLAPEGQGFEQEILLLRSMINRLLSRRPLNHTYISRYMRLLIQAITAKARAPRELTDEEEVDSLIKKHFHKEVDDGKTSYYDLLPVRTAKPGDKWWPWRQLVSIDERRRDGLIDEEDSTMMDAMEEAESRYYGLSDDDPSDAPDILDDDPDDEYEQWPDPDDEDPDDEDPHTVPTVIPEEAVTPNCEEVGPFPSPVGVPLVGTLDAIHADPLPSPLGATGRSPDWADPNLPTGSRAPRIARGRPP